MVFITIFKKYLIEKNPKQLFAYYFILYSTINKDYTKKKEKNKNIDV